MCPRSAKRGYAFEYCCIRSASEKLNCDVDEETLQWCKKKGEKKFFSLAEDEQNEMKSASYALLDFLRKYEKWIDD
ncbi:MAG: hypothetical protein ACQEQF_11630, partial [Bacillota bacterium]